MNKNKEKGNYDIIKVNISSNDSKKQNKLNIEINENMLLDENNKIDTHIPIPESHPKELYQSSPQKFNESEIISYTSNNDKSNSNINTSMISNANTNTNISLFNSNNSNNNNYKIDSIFKEINNTQKSSFDLYKHLKENIKFKEKLCQHGISKDSYYCINCKISTCPKCKNFQNHNNHAIIQKYPYYECAPSLVNNYFSNLDIIFSLNPIFLNVQRVKEELKDHVINHVTQLFNKLTEIKNTKLREIDNMFADTENTVETLKYKINKMKEDLNNFFIKQKTFFCYNINENENSHINNDVNDILLNLQEKKSNIGIIKKNNDLINSGFLIVYDLLKNIQNINQEIKYFLYDIKQNREKYLEEFTNKTKLAYEDLQKMLLSFEGHFNYQYLVIEFYRIVYDKINKYNEKIDKMKKHIFDKVNEKGSYEDIEKDNKIFGTYLNNKFENILNTQLIDEDEALTIKSMIIKSKKSKRNISTNNKISSSISMISRQRSSLFPKGENKDNENSSNKSLYANVEDIMLNNQVLQDNFTYEIFNTVNENFRIKKKKVEEFEEEFDEEIDLAKPIPNKNQMHVYDRKNKSIIKKIVKFDKKIHKYLYFLNGCRTVLIKDKLYIFGGVDKENNISKIAYVYYINTNELKPMPEMLKPHAYHSVQFLDYYKSIIVIGGENSNFCELYDLSTGLWRELPEMKTPRANCILYLDKITHILYAFFGILGKIAEKNNNYTDILECLEFKKLALGWNKIEYKNKAEMNLRNGLNQIYPLNTDLLLVYGGESMRDFIKKAAIYSLPKQEMIKIDNKIFNEIREASQKSKKLYKILNSAE